MFEGMSLRCFCTYIVDAMIEQICAKVSILSQPNLPTIFQYEISGWFENIWFDCHIEKFKGVNEF